MADYTNLRVDVDHTLLPLGIEVAATGGPTFKTAVNESDSGYKQRRAKLTQARHEYNISFGPDDVPSILNIIHCSIGRARGFLIRDPNDYIATNVTLPVVGNVAQLAQAYATTNIFAGGTLRTVTREIVCPDPATIVASPGGYSLGADGTLVYGSPPGTVTASFQFYVPVIPIEDSLVIEHQIRKSDGLLLSLLHNWRLEELLPKDVA